MTHPAPGRRRPYRAALLWAALTGVVVAVLTAGVVARLRPAPVTAGQRPAPATTTITRGDLTEIATAPGELAYGPEQPAESRLPGTVTALAAIGSTVQRGGALFRVDDTPVILLYGSLPAYRALTAGQAGTDGTSGGGAATAPVPAAIGADVRQFEQNLAALGFSGFTVDDTYTEQTAAAVRRWQKQLGLPQTGIVEFGRVFIAPGPVRVAGHKLVAGTAAQGPILAYTGTARLVTASIKVHQQASARPGTPVTVLTPSGSTITGTVVSVGAPANRDGTAGQEPTLEVVVSLGGTPPTGGVDDGPVRVRFVVQERKNVLKVPVGALLALAEGGYGVQIVDPTGSRVVAVTTGLFADGEVEVSGPDLGEGTVVGMAR